MLDAHASRRVLPIVLSCLVLVGCAGTTKATMPPADQAKAAQAQACTDLQAPGDVSCSTAWTLGYSDTWATYLDQPDRRTPEAIASSLQTYSGVQLAAYDAGKQYALSLQR